MQLKITVDEIVSQHTLPCGQVELDTRIDPEQLDKMLSADERRILDAYRTDTLTDEVLTYAEAELVEAYRSLDADNQLEVLSKAVELAW